MWRCCPGSELLQEPKPLLRERQRHRPPRSTGTIAVPPRGRLHPRASPPARPLEQVAARRPRPRRRTRESTRTASSGALPARISGRRDPPLHPSSSDRSRPSRSRPPPGRLVGGAAKASASERERRRSILPLGVTGSVSSRTNAREPCLSAARQVRPQRLALQRLATKYATSRFPGPVVQREHHRLAHAGCESPRLDLAGLHAEAADLHLESVRPVTQRPSGSHRTGHRCGTAVRRIAEGVGTNRSAVSRGRPR